MLMVNKLVLRNQWVVVPSLVSSSEVFVAIIATASSWESVLAFFLVKGVNNNSIDLEKVDAKKASANNSKKWRHNKLARQLMKYDHYFNFI